MLHPHRSFVCSLFFTEATGETAFVPPAMKVGLYFVFCKLSMVAAGQFQPTAARPDVVCVYLQAYLWCAGAPEVGVIVKKFFFFSCQAQLVLQSCRSVSIIISSQYFCPVPISSESGVWMRRGGLWGWRGGGSLYPELAVRSWLPRLCSVWFSHGAEMGEIMIVWWSGGGEDGGLLLSDSLFGSWQPIKWLPTKGRRAELRWLMFLCSPDWLLHHGNMLFLLPDCLGRRFAPLTLSFMC